ncbi:putative glucan 4-alpha-glucosidase-like protein [Phaeoacremonium minimum UCRPA7]|uniref:Putative glucan 4-alpha-glucosidase-like protein n=1 Tax=Phaeoacremonium minimum (strain UCR-PA7) TaxID=1286976 RepID=R8BUL0_PHAM7|nr:putative glucan 4-alpha-glucosidase-like protein [Phaeoacremonium minimum UCRPA7]EOO02990.1 putative glucan 4-alpha-glucosidase-like protein [Phaeoacremonium minimum UCRPA7]
MPPPTPSPDDPDPSSSSPAAAATAARRASAAAKQRDGGGFATPPNRKASAGLTPKSAPAGAGVGAGPGTGPGHARKASASKKPEPTLLSDFLLGRPSPARVAAARRKSVGAAAVKAEVNQQMRQESVRKIQQPGGVQARVKAWQRSNAAAMVRGDPDEAASEPTEILVQVDAESVTEEDRVRIKSRQKTKKKPSPDRSAEIDREMETNDDEGGMEAIPKDPRLRGPPKRRIISDEHWMKGRKGKSPPRVKTKPEASPSPIPKDFLQKTAQNPSIQNKIKDWATRVEVPETPKSAPPKTRKYSTKSGDTVEVEEDGASGRTQSERASSSARTGDDGIRVRPMKPRKPDGGDDGIRITPQRKKDTFDDGIRVKPLKPTPLPDDGIRVRPSRKVSVDEITVRPTSTRRTSGERSTRVPSTRRDQSPSTRIEVIEEPESGPETPTRKSRSRHKAKMRRGATAPSFTETQTEQTENVSDSQSWSDESGSKLSDEPSSAPAKSLAEIPFGNSAFSELDLPLGADHHFIKRPKAQRNNSFKAVPKVFKKVVTGAKEIIHDRVAEPPKPVVNQPPSIESWLNGTVDPFVEKTTPKRKSIEKEWEKDVRRRSSSEVRQKEAPAPAPAEVEELEDQENADPKVQETKEETPKKESPTTPKSGGLKRSRATRSGSSPFKSGGKKPLREALKDVFRGESSGHKLPPMTYPSVEDDKGAEDDYDDESSRGNTRRRSSGSRRRSPSPETLSTVTSTDASTEGPFMTGALPRRKPPTNGQHELSTIVSGDSFSTHDSETMSTLSQTTITQTTALTRSTDLSRQKSQKSGLKRRLTKHSDLVSVLSLPDNADVPARAKSIKSTRNLRRKTSKLENATLDDLLREFADDEHFYQRELKTLVDGVVPVLLTQVVHNNASTTDLFGPTVGDNKVDIMGKAVVNMGVALERLKNSHKRVPLNDVHHLLAWLDSVYPLYDHYLDVWRLGFQGLIVNLAPSGRPDDEDSLINAMDRNEDGDVLDENGERVDVAHLLKRPLVRIKWMHKLLKGAKTLGIARADLDKAIAKFEALQEKARRRHKEETARKTDEDAANTDTTGCSDLRTLRPMDGVLIDPSRQVNAKDSFSLDLVHSNGQRLECQVELIFRDKVEDPSDHGDVLIRETGNGRISLLFPPIPASAMSARKGDDFGTLVVMVRGRHNSLEWYELLSLTSDNDEQVTDWLDILATTPIPPTSPRPASHSRPTSSSSPKVVDIDTPLDELDEVDVPDTMPAISIKPPAESAIESVVSDNSLTPSNSASQAGVSGLKQDEPEFSFKAIASVSYWSNKKGQWKELWHEACSVVLWAGLVEAHPLNAILSGKRGALQSSGASELGNADVDAGAVRPLIALDLTPLVMLRASNFLDLEVRSPVRSYSKLSNIDGTIFRFRSPTVAESKALYFAFHKSRLENAKYKALEEEARILSFGQQQVQQDADGQSSSSRRRSWFGRRNSYRASTRAPSQSQGSSSSVSAPSLLKRLTGGANSSFNIDKSSVDRHSRAGSGSGGGSLYTSGSSSAGGGTPPRSPSVSIAETSRTRVLGSDNLKIRCHLLVSPTKWEDHGNCYLQITRPPPGMRQELRVYHGMEKRVIVTSIPKKESEKPLIVLDVVLGSGCFSKLGARGIILQVWEDLRDEQNNVGVVPAKGGLSGSVKKWCFQCSSAAEANWIFGLVAQEVSFNPFTI